MFVKESNIHYIIYMIIRVSMKWESIYTCNFLPIII